MITEEVLDNLSDSDVAVLADWASRKKMAASDGNIKRAYSLIREGSDLLLRQRALSNRKSSKGENNGSSHIG